MTLRGAALEADRVRREMGRYLAGYRWDHFVTLTTRLPHSAEAIAAAFEQGFVRSLARKSQRSLSYFYAVEGGTPIGGFHHVHALVYGTAALTVRAVERSWLRGFTDVSPYDQKRGAAWYVSKGLDPESDTYSLSRRMPPKLLRAIPGPGEQR